MSTSLLLLACAVVIPTLGSVVPARAESLTHALPPSASYPSSYLEPPIIFDPAAGRLGTPAVAVGSAVAAGSLLGQTWCWQVLPDGFMYQAYLAGGRESRFASHWIRGQKGESLWDVALGGRAAMLRYGTYGALRPEGWQVDIEGAAFPRMTLDEFRDLVSTDFRFGVPLSLRRWLWEAKFAYYHLSSHLGDEYLAAYDGASRINYTRDALVCAVAFWPCDDLRLYAEADWAFYISGPAQPWAFQFGIDYSRAGPTGITGVPFLALNTRLREEVDFSGNLTAQTGWLWRGPSGHTFRLGFHYQNGLSDQFQFHTEHEEQYAVALWYDY